MELEKILKENPRELHYFLLPYKAYNKELSPEHIVKDVNGLECIFINYEGHVIKAKEGRDIYKGIQLDFKNLGYAVIEEYYRRCLGR